MSGSDYVTSLHFTFRNARVAIFSLKSHVMVAPPATEKSSLITNSPQWGLSGRPDTEVVVVTLDRSQRSNQGTILHVVAGLCVARL